MKSGSETFVWTSIAEESSVWDMVNNRLIQQNTACEHRSIAKKSDAPFRTIGERNESELVMNSLWYRSFCLHESK